MKISLAKEILLFEFLLNFLLQAMYGITTKRFIFDAFLIFHWISCHNHLTVSLFYLF